MADLVFNGLRTYLREKLEGHEFSSVRQVQERALAHENRVNESKDEQGSA